MEEAAGIWIIDENGRTKYANERMAEILGTSVQELTLLHSFDFVFPEDISGAARMFDAKRSGDRGTFRFRLRRRDGTAVHTIIQGTPQFEEGAFRGIVGTFTVDETKKS